MQLIPFKPCRAQALGDLPGSQMKVAFQNQGLCVVRDSKTCWAKIWPCFYQCKMGLFQERSVYVHCCKTDHYLAKKCLILTCFPLNVQEKQSKINKWKCFLPARSFITSKTPHTIYNSFREFFAANRFYLNIIQIPEWWLMCKSSQVGQKR